MCCDGERDASEVDEAESGFVQRRYVARPRADAQQCCGCIAQCQTHDKVHPANAQTRFSAAWLGRSQPAVVSSVLTSALWLHERDAGLPLVWRCGRVICYENKSNEASKIAIIRALQQI